MNLTNDPFFKEVIEGKHKCRNSKKEKVDFYNDLSKHYAKYNPKHIPFSPDSLEHFPCINVQNIKSKKDQEKKIHYINKCLAKIPCFNVNGSNILLGDLENALIIITAHFDTPLVSIKHYLTNTRRFVIYSTINRLALFFTYTLIYLSSTLYLLSVISTSNYPLIFFLLIIAYLLFPFLYSLIIRLPNSNNANDNSTAVCLALYLLEKHHGKIAVILFDQEEKGKLGSRELKSSFHLPPYDKKLFINLDSIGCKDIIFIRDDDNCHLNSDSLVIAQLNVLFKESLPTDYTNLPKGRRIDITTANGDMKNLKSQNYGYIHSKGDTEIDPKMIDNVISIIEHFVPKRSRPNRYNLRRKLKINLTKKR